MLFPYKFAWDDIRHVQSFVNYIMLEVILKSHKSDKPNLLAAVEIEKYWTLIKGVNDDYKKHTKRFTYDGKCSNTFI